MQMEIVNAHQDKLRLNGSQDATQQAQPASPDKSSQEASAHAHQVSRRQPLVLDAKLRLHVVFQASILTQQAANALAHQDSRWSATALDVLQP
jgi:hypothetical protein